MLVSRVNPNLVNAFDFVFISRGKANISSVSRFLYGVNKIGHLNSR